MYKREKVREKQTTSPKYTKYGMTRWKSGAAFRWLTYSRSNMSSRSNQGTNGTSYIKNLITSRAATIPVNVTFFLFALFICVIHHTAHNPPVEAAIFAPMTRSTISMIGCFSYFHTILNILWYYLFVIQLSVYSFCWRLCSASRGRRGWGAGRNRAFILNWVFG